MNKNSIEAPVALKVLDLMDLARLALALTDEPQILWHFAFEGKQVLAHLSSYIYWSGDVPILSYAFVEEPRGIFLGYRGDGQAGEEYIYSKAPDDPKYNFASIVHLKRPPKLFEDSLCGRFRRPVAPIAMDMEDISNIIRAMLPQALKDGASMPIWQFRRGDEFIMGSHFMLEHYYDFDSLPMFLYTKLKERVDLPFVRYNASKSFGERVEFSKDTSDSKFFYAKIINIEDFPLFP